MKTKETLEQEEKDALAAQIRQAKLNPDKWRKIYLNQIELFHHDLERAEDEVTKCKSQINRTEIILKELDN